MTNLLKKSFLAVLILSLTGSLTLASCTNRDKNLGTEKNPIIISFMPSADEKVMEINAKTVADRLAEVSGLKFKVHLSDDFIGIVDRLGSKKADVAFINSLGYLLARDWSGAVAMFQLKGIDGKMNYKSALITNSSTGINRLSDFNGRSFGYTNSYSMAGYLMPLYMFTENDIKPAGTSFLESYNSVVESVYKKIVDGGAIYYHKPDPYGRVRDARAKLIVRYTDLLDKVKVIETSEPIPNTPIVYRKAIPTAVQKKLTEAFTTLSTDSKMIFALGNMYDATGYGPADSRSFNKILDILKKLNKKIEEVVPGALTFYKKHIWEVSPEY